MIVRFLSCVAAGAAMLFGCSDNTRPAALGGTGWLASSVVDSGITYPYRVFVPENYTSAQSWPVIISLHGTGERGTDNQKQLTAGLALHVKANESTWSAITIFPQIAGGHWDGSRERAVLAELAQVQAQYAVDASRIYLTGYSAGGMGTYGIDIDHPGFFAAIVPIAAAVHLPCGTPEVPGTPCRPWISQIPAADTANGYAYAAQHVTPTPTWIFHGALDPNVSVTEARKMYAALTAAGDPVHYTEFPNVGHDSWDPAYARADLWTWLFAQHR